MLPQKASYTFGPIVTYGRSASNRTHNRDNHRGFGAGRSLGLETHGRYQRSDPKEECTVVPRRGTVIYGASGGRYRCRQWD